MGFSENIKMNSVPKNFLKLEWSKKMQLVYLWKQSIFHSTSAVSLLQDCDHKVNNRS